MAAHGRTLETSASPDQVWELWSDVTTWSSWNPDVISVSIDGPFASGTTGRMTTKAGGTHAITLTEVEAGRSFRLETSPVPLSRFAFHCEVRPGAGATVIAQSVTMRGPLGGVFSAMMGGRIAEGFQPLLAGLKAAAESEGGA